jgi:cytosine/adenosine deaminase-related metal-dependent hydrolase
MMDDRIGSLESGKDADVLMIDRRGDTHLSPPSAILPNLVYGNGPSPESIHRVMVRGRTVVENGEHVLIDRYDAVKNLDELQDTLFDEVSTRRFSRIRSRFNWV